MAGRFATALAVLLGVLPRPVGVDDPVACRTAATHPMRYHLALPDGDTHDAGKRWPVLVRGADADFAGLVERFRQACGPRPFLLLVPCTFSNVGTFFPCREAPDHRSERRPLQAEPPSHHRVFAEGLTAKDLPAYKEKIAVLRNMERNEIPQLRKQYDEVQALKQGMVEAGRGVTGTRRSSPSRPRVRA
jgi:hypothetical protein